MKKLLAIVMVLGLASFASASLTLSPGGALNVALGSSTVITVSSTDAGNWLGYIQVVPGGNGALMNATKLVGAGGMGGVNAYADSAGIGFELTTAGSQASPPAPLAGPQFSFNFVAGTKVGTALIQLWDDRVGYEQPVGQLAVNVVPEPITMTLMGLGGLVALRRRMA